MTKKVALLTPRSVLYPTISFDMMAGLKLCLAEMGVNDVEIVTENIDTGSDDKLIYAVCERLLLQGVGIIAGYVNPTTAEMLAPMFVTADAVFISLDSGFHYRTSMTKADHVFYVSLESALCCRVVTRLAAEEGRKKMAFTSSFYDSGYKSGYSFVSSLENSGGSVTFNHITQLKRADFDLTPLAEHLRGDDETQAIFASFCGDMLQDFFTEAGNKKIFKHHPVYAAPFVADEQWLSQAPYPGADIKACVSWATDLDTVANKFFVDVMTKKKKNANLFSLLGWEAALLINRALKATDCQEAIALLENYTYNSPRGEVTIDGDTHETNAPIYEAWIQKDKASDGCVLKPLHESMFTDEERYALEHDINNFTGQSARWFNSYGCLLS